VIFSISFPYYDDNFGAFEKDTTRISLKLVNKMGYKGKDLRFNDPSGYWSPPTYSR